jgi:hypothetical protein
MFYAAAAMRTEALKWAFDGATEIECVIVQPPMIKRWVTTPERIATFERELVRAVKIASQEDAPLSQGDHCRWCAAKPICPQMTGAVDRAIKQQIVNLDVDTLAQHLHTAELLEGWIKDLRALAFGLLEQGATVPGYKLVQKQARRQWVDPTAAAPWLISQGVDEVFTQELISPAQAEKVLKKRKVALRDDLVVAVSSGTTLAPVDDPRPAVQSFIGLSKALSKL